MTYGSSNPSSVSAGMQHSGFDRNAAALTGKKHLMRQTTIETSGPPGKKRRVSVRPHSKTVNSLSTSSNREEEVIYDKHLLANMGPQRLTGLTLNCGKRAGYIPAVERFLKNLVQSGKIISQWNGSLHSDIDERTVAMQFFRHRYSDDGDPSNIAVAGNLKQGPYTQVTSSITKGYACPMILWPQNKYGTGSQAYELNNPANTLAYNTSHYQSAPATGDKVQNAFYDHFCGQVAFSAVNRPDLEDMSWNLNKLKLKGPQYSGDNNDSLVIDFHKNTQVYGANRHRRQSILQQNNFHFVNPLDVGLSDSTHVTIPAVGSTASSYVYDANLKHGLIEYDFSNKNDTGCTVEIIVYKVKRTANLSAKQAAYTTAEQYLDPVQTNPTNPSSNSGTAKCAYPLNLLVTSIGQGYMNTVVDKYSTENLEGRIPSIIDVYSNPAYPLLPKLRKTVESTNPFSEVMRNKFVMTSGSRRSVDIKLPGVLYNPCAIPLNPPPTPSSYSTAPDQGHNYQLETGITPFPQPQVQSENIPCIDEHSYAVVIAVNGQKMTRFFDSKPFSGYVTFTPRFPSPQGSGLNPNDVPYPYQFFLPYNASDPLSQQTGNANKTTYRLAYLNDDDPAVTTITAMTCDIVLYDYVDPGGFPAPVYPSGGDTYNRYFVLDNCQENGYSIIPNIKYFIVGFQTGLVGPTFDSKEEIYILSDGKTTNSGQPPTELPMGDNHGACLVDYSAKYTEHIGACVYKDAKEKLLYAAGQPEPPALKPVDTGSSTSVTSSRLIVPATQVVRQQARAIQSVNASGQPTNVSVEQDVRIAAEDL